jgi:CSLREA domain-containing protein
MTLVRLFPQIGSRAARIARAIALPALIALPAAGGANAAAFTVTSALDPGNGVCDATCTLREAIAAANANGSAVTDSINFNLAGTGPFAILVNGSALPTITTPVAISGAGEAIIGRPGIQVDGAALASGNGLAFGATADGSAVYHFDPDGNFIELMLRLASQGKLIRVVEDHTASPTYAPFLAARTADLVEREAAGILHIGGGTPTSWFDYARLIFRVAGIEAALTATTEREYRTAARRPKYSALSNAKMESLGLKPMPPLEQAVRDYFSVRNRVSAM